MLAAILAGCTEPVPQTPRTLGQVSYDGAFVAARRVLSQYYSISEADSVSGVIKCRPKLAETSGERLIGRHAARETATLRLSRQDGQVDVGLSIQVQQLASPAYRQSRSADNYNQVPNQTPAEMEAATTAEQNDTWRTTGYNHARERQILDELYQAIRPAQSQPAKAGPGR